MAIYVRMSLISAIAQICLFWSFPSVSAEPKAQCINDLNRALLFLEMNAEACGLSEKDLKSPRITGAQNLAPNSPPDRECTGPLNVNSNNNQQNAFVDCWRVYYCATQASKMAINLINGGTDCNEAVGTGMRVYPIPGAKPQ